MDERVEQLVMDQMPEVQAQHPCLELQRDPTGPLWVRGAVGFTVEHDGRTVEDAYQLALEIPHDYPESPPSVFETQGRIPEEFGHFMDAGNFCLEAPVEVRRRFAQHRNLLRFIDDQVIPYLFSYSYKREYGKLPYKDRPHWVAGLLDYYKEYFETSEIGAMGLLKCLADDLVPPLAPCPCGSGRKLRDCHARQLNELRPHMAPNRFEAELRQMIQAARASGVRLPEKRVLPRRMLKNFRRRSQRANMNRRKRV